MMKKNLKHTHALPIGVQMQLKHFNQALAVELQTPRGETESLWQNKTERGES